MMGRDSEKDFDHYLVSLIRNSLDLLVCSGDVEHAEIEPTDSNTLDSVSNVACQNLLEGTP